MSWTPSVRLFIAVNPTDGSTVLLAPTDTGYTAFSDVPRISQGDEMPLQLVFVDVVANAITSLPSGWTILFSAKQSVNGTQQTTLLLSADTFIAFTDGDITGYESDLNVNIAAIDTLFTALTKGDELDIRCEILLQNAGATLRKRFHFADVLERKTYASEGVPTSGDPVYPLPDAIITTDQISIPAGKRLVVNADLTLELQDV